MTFWSINSQKVFRKVLIASFLFLIVLSLHNINSLEIDNCLTIEQEHLGQTLDLNSDIEGWTDNCFTLNVSDDDNFFAIDCNNHSIDSNDDSLNFFYTNSNKLNEIKFVNCNISFSSFTKMFYFENIANEYQIDINLNNSYLLFNGTGAIGFDFENTDINLINIYDLNLTFGSRSIKDPPSPSALFYLTGSSDLNYINVDFDTEFLLTKGYVVYFNDIYDDYLQFDFNSADVNVNSTTINNGIFAYFYVGNIAEVNIDNLNIINYNVNDASFVYVTGASADLNKFIFDGNIILDSETASFFKAENVSENDVNVELGDSNVVVISGNMIELDDADYNTVFVNGGDVGVNVNGVLLNFVDNTDLNYFVSQGSEIDLNGLFFVNENVTETEFSFENSDVNGINIYDNNFDVNTLFYFTNSNVNDLNIFDSNIAFNYLFHIEDSNVNGIIYENYLYDKNSSENDFVVNSFAGFDVNIDFNLTSGNYWFDENANIKCLDSTNDYICETAYLVYLGDLNYYDYKPLTTISNYEEEKEEDNDRGSGGGGGGGSSIVLNTDTNEDDENKIEITDEKINVLKKEMDYVNVELNNLIDNLDEYIIILDEKLLLGETQIIYVINSDSKLKPMQIDLNITLPDKNYLIVKTDNNGYAYYKPDIVGSYSVKVNNIEKEFNVIQLDSKNQIITDNEQDFIIIICVALLIIFGVISYIWFKYRKRI